MRKRQRRPASRLKADAASRSHEAPHEDMRCARRSVVGGRYLLAYAILGRPLVTERRWWHFGQHAERGGVQGERLMAEWERKLVG